MADKKNEKESFIEKVLRSVLISSKGGVPLQKLNYEFKDLLGQGIPFKENGFKTVEAYLKTMPTVCQIRRDPTTGETVCMGVANEETKHLDRLVKKQKATKKKSKPARLPKYSGRSSNRPRRPPPQNYRPKPSYHSQQQQYPSKKSTSWANHPQGRSGSNYPQSRSGSNYPQSRSGSENFKGPQRNGGNDPHRRNDIPRNGTNERNSGPRNGPHQRDDGPRDWPHQRTDGPRNWPHQRSDAPSNVSHQRNYPSGGGGGESWSQRQGDNRPAPNTQRNNQQERHNQQPKHQQQHQHSSTYEVPPRFRRQVYSTGSASDDYHETPYNNERSKSDSDYPVQNESNNNEYIPEDIQQQPPQQPPQPPPVDGKVVSWVNETLAEKSGGLWLSGLKKLYKEKFQTTMEDDLIEKLTRLSLWTAEEIGLQRDPILYPNLRLGDPKTLSTESLRSKRHDESQRISTSVVGNDQILYPNLKVEINQSPLSGKERRNVTNQLAQTVTPASVPDIVIPEEECLWEVYVSYIISVVDFYCVIMGDDYADKLCTLEDDMREYYDDENHHLRLNDLPVVDGLYAAQMSDDWLRVKVIAVDNQEAGCFLVDHGDVESIPLDDLRVLDPAFYQLAFQAISCKLHGMEDKATSKTATDRFCNIALGQTRLAQVISKDSKRMSLTMYRNRLNINYLCALGDVP